MLVHGPRCPTCRVDLEVAAPNTQLAEFGEKFFRDAEARRLARIAAAAAVVAPAPASPAPAAPADEASAAPTSA